jgi:fatty-acyl-CoA synthase
MDKRRRLTFAINGIANQADVLAIEAAGIPDLPASTYELIRRGSELDPAAPALSYFRTTKTHRDPERWTYANLLRDVTRAANMFGALGVRPDHVVAYVLPNLPETHFTIWGGEAAGVVLAINALLEPAAIAQLIKAAGARLLVTLAPLPGTEIWPKLQPVLSHMESLQHLVLVNPGTRAGGATLELALSQQAEECQRLHGVRDLRSVVPLHMDVHDFWEAMARARGDELDSRRRFSAEDISSYFCTGGTTGLPKLAVRRHGNEVANAWATAQFLGDDGFGPGKTSFSGLPLFHVNAVQATGLTSFAYGAHVLLGTPEGYRGEGVIQRFWEIVEHHRVNFFSGVPTLYASLLNVPIADHDVSSLQYGFCGAAPMPVEVLRSFQARTGIKILEAYGLTEGTCVSTVNPPKGERRPGSIGLRIPFQDMKPVILDDAGTYVRDCAPDEAGVLLISGLNVFSGYLAPEQNKDVWPDLGDGRRWLNTGDLGRCDPDGYFWLTGRKKELIIRGGHNIDPAVIEEPLHRHPAVQLAAAVGRPDAHAGELVVAYVQLRSGAEATEAELIEFLRGAISERAALPKHIRLAERIPLTAVGKIFKPALKRLEIIDALRSALIDAGISAASVTPKDEGSNTVSIALEDPSSEPAARAVLGRFPFPFAFCD